MNDWTAIAVIVCAVASCTAITAIYEPKRSDDAVTICMRNGCTQADRIECLKATEQKAKAGQ